MKTLIALLTILTSFGAFAGPFKDFRSLRQMHREVTALQSQIQNLQPHSYGVPNPQMVCATMPRAQGAISQSIFSLKAKSYVLQMMGPSFAQTADALLGLVDYIVRTCQIRPNPTRDQYILDSSSRVQAQAAQLVLQVETAIRN